MINKNAFDSGKDIKGDGLIGSCAQTKTFDLLLILTIFSENSQNLAYGPSPRTEGVF